MKATPPTAVFQRSLRSSSLTCLALLATLACGETETQEGDAPLHSSTVGQPTAPGSTSPVQTNPEASPTSTTLSPTATTSSPSTPLPTGAPSSTNPSPTTTAPNPAPASTEPGGAGGGPSVEPTPSGTSTAPTEPTTAPTEPAPAPTHTRDHCVDGYEPHPDDATMSDGPAEHTEAGQVDLTVQPQVIDWFSRNEWQAAHFEWHSIRRCTGGMSQSRVNICSRTEMIPADQECRSDGDGYQFLVMHRHMIQTLQQLFPNNREQFEGFDRFPQSADEVPQQWRNSWSSFSQQAIANAKIADEIDQPENLSRFESEGAFGRWLQCFPPSASGLHGDLHFKWVRSLNTTHGLGNQHTNIDNYMFWKLHGWIDKVWEKYRVAKGLTPDDPKLKADLTAQCREMDTLARIIDPNLESGPSNPGPTPMPEESGFFHERVRPIFESDTYRCSGCHSPNGPEAALTLGGQVSSAEIVANLVGQGSVNGGQFSLVVPGNPEQSWLYRKVAGTAGTAGCTPSGLGMCNTQVMPPNGTGQALVNATDLATLREWIQSGAPEPQ